MICFIYLGWTVVEGHQNNVTDIDFGPQDTLEVECKADHSKKELGNEQLRLRKKQDCVCTCGALTVSCTRPLLAALITTFYYLSVLGSKLQNKTRQMCGVTLRCPTC